MRVLVTRPQPSATATAARLEALGHEAIVLPMMEAIHRPQAALDILALPHAAITVTSAEAIRALSAIKNQLAPHLQTPVFCVGTATAEATKALGFQSVIAGPGTGLGLAQQIADTAKSLDDGLVYLAGLPRSPGFETALRQAGIRCRVADVYRMSPIAHAPETIENLLSSRKPEAVLFYSHETARHFFALNAMAAKTAFHDMRLLCLSEHVADAVPRGIGHIATAAQPNEKSLFALL
ncbi:uroporphyrinogen-III synthase [Pararhizobium sp. LjRoot235]|uniref:uroporphyrinogen-III synthase n=1 Tax=Pararhizobium sp. LjRoot235 TaxID=3342291 RepID=UPI003ECC60F1